MYVIGLNEDEYLQFVTIFTCNEKGHSDNKIRIVWYDINSIDATTISSYEEAKERLDDIKENYEDIDFNCKNVLTKIMGRDKMFNKKEYIDNLKIYRLIPELVEK